MTTEEQLHYALVAIDALLEGDVEKAKYIAQQVRPAPLLHDLQFELCGREEREGHSYKYVLGMLQTPVRLERGSEGGRYMHTRFEFNYPILFRGRRLLGLAMRLQFMEADVF